MFQFLRIIFLINLCKDRVSPFFIPSSLFHSIPRLLIPSYPSLPSSFHTSPTHPILSIPPLFIPYLADSSHPIHPSPLHSIPRLLIPSYPSLPFSSNLLHLSPLYSIRRLLIPSFPSLPFSSHPLFILYTSPTNPILSTTRVGHNTRTVHNKNSLFYSWNVPEKKTTCCWCAWFLRNFPKIGISHWQKFSVGISPQKTHVKLG